MPTSFLLRRVANVPAHRVSGMRRWPNRIRIVAAWLAALLLCSGMIWAVSWFRPQKPVALILAGAGYQENLAVPHNACGWRGLNDLAKIPNAGNSDNNFVSPDAIATIDSAFSWSTIGADVSQDSLVIVISAHGAVDERGAYLLPNDYRGSRTERVRLDELWTALKSMPEHRNKLLILDVTQVAGDWRLGFLNNDFVRALLAENERINAIPHLTVICSSDVDEQSWVDSSRGQTIFLYYLRAGLRGHVEDSDHNGRINAAELHSDVSQRVTQWVAKHRGVVQQPLLLPLGKAGQQRAERIDLTIARGKVDATSVETQQGDSQQELQDAWKRYAELLEASPQVFARGPTYWREYVDTLLRYEQLQRAGDRQFAARMRERLSGIEYRMDRQRAEAHASLQNSLSLHYVANLGPLPRSEAIQVLNQLWAADDGKRAKLWQTALANGDNDVDRTQLLRLAVMEVLLDRATEDPAANLARAAEIVEVIRSPLHPLPAELHFMAMLAKYLPEDALSASETPRIQQALTLRRLAERAAVGHHDGDVDAMERALPWIAQDVQSGDEQRRLGEDLLFAGAEERAGADEYLKAAQRSYQQAIQDAKRVEEALETRDKVLAQLPYYSQWLADATLDPYVANARHEAALQEAEELWQQVHTLVQMLEQPDRRWITRAPPPTTERPQPLSLVDQNQLVAGKFDELAAQYLQIVTAIAQGEAIPHWHTTQRALHVPLNDWKLRAALLAKAQEHDRGNSAGAAESALTAPAMTDAAEIVSHRTDSQQTAMTNARWQGRMALALLGRRTFQTMRSDDAESFDQVKHRLDLIDVERQWWDSMAVAAAQIFDRSAILPERITMALKHAQAHDPAELTRNLAAADRWSRSIDGAQASQLKSRPSILNRRALLQNLAVNLAQRTLADHWYGLDPHAEPYYRLAGLAYLNDAQRLLADSPEVAKAREQMLADGSLQFRAVSPLELTTQQRVTLDSVLEPLAAAKFESGFPVNWLNSGNGIELIQPAAGQRIVRRFDRMQQGGDVAVALTSQPLQEAERDLSVSQVCIKTDLTIHGFFRGQLLIQQVPVTLHLRPEIADYRFPLPQTGAISLSTTDAIATRFGTGDGAIAFIVDCSGSMGPPAGETDATKSKYADAVRALEKVLARVPQGTKISVWTFGQYSARSGQSPEDSIRQLQRPIAWNPGDPAQLRQLMAKLDPQRVRPWNESPIVRTILAAKEDVADADGFKTILVITDGMDNRFAQDRGANPNGQAIPQALRQTLAETGIALNIVAFKVTGGEEVKLQQQFAVVEQLFPPGQVYRVNETESLADTLATALGHRMRFQIASYDRDAVPLNVDIGRAGGGEVWSREPLPAGAYQLRVATTPPVQTNVTLVGGDVLALTLDQQDGRYVVRRTDASSAIWPHRPSQQQGSWRATVLQNSISPRQTLRLGVALENSLPQSESFLSQRTPRSVWYEVQPSSGQQSGISWQRMLGYPAAAWHIAANDWPATPDGQGLAQPKLQAWWSFDAATPFSAEVKRDEQRPGITEMSGVALATAGETVQLESVALEDHYVEVSPGKRAAQSCLVVRLKSKPGNIYWAELQGLQTPGVEQRFYPSIGSYTALFWPVTRAEVERTLQGIGIVSLEVFKREAQTRSNFIEFDKLSAPDANDILPTPSFSLE